MVLHRYVSIVCNPLITEMLSRNPYLNQLIFLIRGYRYYAFFLAFLAIIIGIIDALSVALLYPMLSEGFNINADSIPFYQAIETVGNLFPIGSTFVHLGLLFIILTGTSLGLQLFYWKIAFIFKREIVIKVKTDLFEKIDSNDYQFFVDTKQGDLINLFNQSPYYIEQTFDRILGLCTDLISSLLIIGMLFLISPGGLLLVILSGGLFYLVLNRIGAKISEKLGLLQIASGQSENKVINEYITGIKPITSLHASEHWKSQYAKALELYWDKYADLMFIQKIPIIAINSLFYISVGIIVLALYIYYSDNFITIIPILGTFAAGTMKVLPKFMNLGDYKLQLKNYQPHVSNVYAYLTDDNYNHIQNGSRIFSTLDSDILFQGISFSYGHTEILRQATITIKKGSMTALVGPSGSGKSTIVGLLLRLYDPNDGKIIVNGTNLKEFEIGSYRSLIGYVSQDPFVFNDTIRNNITFGGKYSDYDLINAANLAYAHEFIQKLPNGYDTVVGDQGVTLSGGEKQRIAISRAMIRQPDILILDEATSALDNISEAAVQLAIDSVSKKCTTLVIAHRLTTIRNASNIVVIENGEILEEGNHQCLLEKKGKYYEMYTASQKTDNCD